MRKLLALLLVVLIGAIIITAQEPLQIGDVIDGELTGDQPRHLYTVSVPEGATLTVILESRDFDAFLAVLDEDGDVVAEDDDSAGQLNAELAVDAPGDYTIVATSVREYQSEGEFFATGAYTLTLAGDAPAEVTEEPGGGTIFDQADDTTGFAGDITPGESLDGRLTESNLVRTYEFSAPAGEIITITLTSDEFDTYLTLLDDNGDVIRTDDDSAGDLNSRIGPFVIPADGDYTLVVDSFSGEATGQFMLTMESAALETLAYGEPATGTLNSENTLVVYQVPVAAGDTLLVSLETDSFSTYVRVDDTAGLLLRETFGGSEVVGPFIAEADGNYVVTVSTFDTFTESDYTVTVEEIAPQPLTLNETVALDFTTEDVQFYTFEGSAGDVINITVESEGTVDTFVVVNDPDGFELAFDDDGGEDFDPEVNTLILPVDGTYGVLVQPYIPGDAGDATLLVENTGLPSLDEGAQVIRVSDKTLEGVASFEGVAGETVAVSVRVLSTMQNDPFITVTQNGETLASNSVGMVERLTLEFTVPEDGQVVVRVEDLSFNPVIVELALAERSS